MRWNWRVVAVSVGVGVAGFALYMALILVIRFVPGPDSFSDPPCPWASDDDWAHLAEQGRAAARSVGGTYSSSTCRDDLVAHVNLDKPVSAEQIARALAGHGWALKGSDLCSIDDPRIVAVITNATRTLNLEMSEESVC